jgi:cell wall assembly regulator SMI1
MKTVKELWQALMGCYKEQGYSGLSVITTLHKPINETEYRDLQKAIGSDCRIPEDYLELLKIHNGSGQGQYDLENFSFGLYMFMTSSRCITDMHTFRAEVKDGWYGRGDGTPHHVHGVQPVFWDDKWLPILYTEDNRFICIDFNPAIGGKVGQVIEVYLKSGPVTRWDNFLTFFQKTVEKILKDPEGEIFLSAADERAYAEIEKRQKQGEAPEPTPAKKSSWFDRFKSKPSTESMNMGGNANLVPVWLDWANRSVVESFKQAGVFNSTDPKEKK